MNKMLFVIMSLIICSGVLAKEIETPLIRNENSLETELNRIQNKFKSKLVRSI